MPPTVLYVAGPMSGIPQFNIPAFDAAADRLRRAGYRVISPAELDDPGTRACAVASPDGDPSEGVNGHSWLEFLTRDIEIVNDQVDGVALLSGWQESPGARIETLVANHAEIPVKPVEDWLDISPEKAVPYAPPLPGPHDPVPVESYHLAENYGPGADDVRTTERIEGPLRHPGSARFHEILREMGELHDRKQRDYGSDDDPFANVRASEEWGMPPWVGALLRATDKVRRLQSYAQRGTLANEGVIDSMMDLAVYAIIARVLFEDGSE